MLSETDVIVPTWWLLVKSAVFVIICLSVLFGVFGVQVGVTRLYIRALLAVFEWGRERILVHQGNQEDATCEEQEQIESPEVDGQIPIYYSERYISHRQSMIELNHGFHLTDAMYFCRKGMQVIVEDIVTQRFDAAELPSWNLLTRTNTHYQFISWRLTFLWLGGCILRLVILFPFRAVLFVLAMLMLIVGTFVIGFLPDGSLKRQCNYRWTVISYRVLMRSFLGVVRFHDRQNRANGGGICVANHTSPVDVLVLGCDNCYTMVGQAQGGFMGFLQRAMSRSEHHIWFQRTEAKDRMSVVSLLREHVDDPAKRPILIFPEGTCVNNTSIMMFKKGSFEIGRTMYPVAIKYDERFADAFWNSSKQTFLRHFLNILTSWSLVVDVWYLPPETQWPDESAIEFTNRVKAIIAKQGGLVELEWDGQLKRDKPNPSILLQQQQQYSKHIIGQDTAAEKYTGTGPTGNDVKFD